MTEIIELADQDVLDLTRSRKTKQEVMDFIDDPKAWRDLVGRSRFGRKNEACSDNVTLRSQPITIAGDLHPSDNTKQAKSL